MSFIGRFRVAALSLSLLLGLVVLGLASHWIQVTTTVITIGPTIYTFEIVALVAGALAALSLPPMLVIGQIRRGAFISKIAVELTTLAVLWGLFLAVGVLTAEWKDVLYPTGCGDTVNLDIFQQGWCREFLAIMDCSFVAWIILLLYTVTLLVFALIGQSRGNTVWTTSVEGASFFANKPANGMPQPATGVPQPATGVPQPGVAPVYIPFATAQYPMMQQSIGPAPGHSGVPQV